MAFAFLAAALAPATIVVWWFPGFATQDGPSHHYNAHILRRSFDAASPYRRDFQVRWEPLPNWAGHAVLMALDAAFPAVAVDRAMTTLTLVAFAASILWLRLQVVGAGSPGPAAALAAILGLNVAWLLGFGAFLLGAALFPITLGVWWRRRERGWSARRALGLAALLVLGYFSHLVSLGLTAFGLVVLEAATPGRERRGRLATTTLGLSPLVPLAVLYRSLMRRGGGLSPEWKHLASPLSPASWVAQLTWVDPISLARKDYLPLVGTVARRHLAAAPVLWLGVALGLATAAAFLAGRGPWRDRERRGWWWLGGGLLLAGTIGPDTLGAGHGEYLQLRVVLLGLVALATVLEFGGSKAGRCASAALLLALGLQTAVVRDYGARSERTAGAILRAGPALGTGLRVATLLTDLRTPFRSNPLLHADAALGVGTGNVLWSNYETRFYYFPVQFRDGIDHPDPALLERIALAAPGDPERLALWSTLLERHHSSIDAVLTWGEDATLDAVTAARFVPGGAGRGVRVWRKRRGEGNPTPP